MRQRDTYLYRLADYVTAMVAWALFFMWRKWMEGVPVGWEALQDLNFYYGIFIVPTGWFLFYSLFDDYKDIYRLARLSTLARTFVLTFVGVCFLFVTLLMDDVVRQYTSYLVSFSVLFGLHFSLTAAMRMLLLTRAHSRLKNGIVSFPTLMIGGGKRAQELYNELKDRKEGVGYRFVGFIITGQHVIDLPQVGSLEDLTNTIREKRIEDVIIAIENNEHDQLKTILHTLFEFGDKIHIQIVPDMYDIMLGNVRMNEVMGAALIHIKQELMPKWERLLKRLMDVVISILVLTFLAPLYLYIYAMVKFSSPGPVFYRQERIGLIPSGEISIHVPQR